ncbi:hypothetical protein ACCS91_37760 [Rhizobium ruizarguesonis]
MASYFQSGTSNMKRAAIFVCLAFVFPPLLANAQQGTKSNGVPIVAYLGTIKYAVRKSPPSPLGYYYSVAGATKVKFHECGDVKAPVDLSPSDIIDTTEDCGSLPGTPASPLYTNVITSWTYESGKDVFLKAMVSQDKEPEIVNCQDVPASIIAAAKGQQSFEKGIVAEQTVDWKSIEDQLHLPSDTKKEAVLKAPKSNDCSGLTKFWTLPIADEKVKALQGAVGLTVADPGNPMMVRDLEKQLQAN